MRQNSFLYTNPFFTFNLNPQIIVNQRPQSKTSPFVISNPSFQPYQKHRVSSKAHWNNQQKDSYSVFVCYFRQLLPYQNGTNNLWDMFKGMSKFIKTRNPQQCRSYHLKLLKQFGKITNFIDVAIRRVPNLRQKILYAQRQLSEIQLQYGLYLSYNSGQKQIVDRSKLTKEARGEFMLGQQLVNRFSFTKFQQKIQKQDQIKTADSYIQQQKPVNFINHNNYTYQNTQPLIQPSQPQKTKTNTRKSLPSFADEQNPKQHQFKSEHKIDPPITNKPFSINHSFLNYGFDQKITNPLQNTINFQNNQQFDSNQIEKRQMQRMREFLECHYLFQLWMSKLQKIMRES